jgi:hypothetical protein
MNSFTADDFTQLVSGHCVRSKTYCNGPYQTNHFLLILIMLRSQEVEIRFH